MDKLTDLKRKVEEIREVDLFKKAKICFCSPQRCYQITLQRLAGEIYPSRGSFASLTSNEMQWKMCPSGKDNRPGLAGLHHLVAVLVCTLTLKEFTMQCILQIYSLCFLYSCCNTFHQKKRR